MARRFLVRLFSGCALLVLHASANAALAEPLASGDRSAGKDQPSVRNFDWTRPTAEEIAPNPASAAKPRPHLRDVTDRRELVESDVRWEANDPGIASSPEAAEASADKIWSRPKPAEIVPNPAVAAGARPYLRSVSAGVAAKQGNVRNYTDTAYRGTDRTYQTPIAGGGTGDGAQKGGAAASDKAGQRGGQNGAPRDGAAGAAPDVKSKSQGGKGMRAGTLANVNPASLGQGRTGVPVDAPSGVGQGVSQGARPGGADAAAESAATGPVGAVRPGAAVAPSGDTRAPNGGSQTGQAGAAPASHALAQSDASSRAESGKGNTAGSRGDIPGLPIDRFSSAPADTTPSGGTRIAARSGSSQGSPNATAGDGQVLPPSREIVRAGRPADAEPSSQMAPAPGQADLGQAGRGIRGPVASDIVSDGRVAAQNRGDLGAGSATRTLADLVRKSSSGPSIASGSTPDASVQMAGATIAPGRLTLAEGAPATVRGSAGPGAAGAANSVANVAAGGAPANTGAENTGDGRAPGSASGPMSAAGTAKAKSGAASADKGATSPGASGSGAASADNGAATGAKPSTNSGDGSQRVGAQSDTPLASGAPLRTALGVAGSPKTPGSGMQSADNGAGASAKPSTNSVNGSPRSGAQSGTSAAVDTQQRNGSAAAGAPVASGSGVAPASPAASTQQGAGAPSPAANGSSVMGAAAPASSSLAGSTASARPDISASSSSSSSSPPPSGSGAPASSSASSSGGSPPLRVNLFAKLDFPTLFQTLALPHPPPTPPSSPVTSNPVAPISQPPRTATPQLATIVPTPPIAVTPPPPQPAPPPPSAGRDAAPLAPVAAPAPAPAGAKPTVAAAPPLSVMPPAAQSSPPQVNPRPLMATLRDQARQVDWEQARADGLAILRKQITLDQLGLANRDNLQRARDVMARLAESESYYRTQTLVRLDTYDKLKGEYVKYVHQRDQAAMQGMVGGAGLAVIYTADMAGHILAASGIPLAKFYNTVRGAADQTVTAVKALSSPATPALIPAPVPVGAGTGTDAPSALPRWATANGIGTNATNLAGPSTAADGGQRLPANTAKAPGAKTADEQIRSVATSLQVAREFHKAIEETARQSNEISGIDRLKGWTTPKQPGTRPEDSTALKISKGAGELADTSLKLATSVADVQIARRSGDTDKIFAAESQALRSSLQTGAKLIGLGQRSEKLAGVRGPSGEFGVPAQLMKGFQAADKVVSGAQTAVNAVDAYYDARDGHYDKAWRHARDGVTNAAKTFTGYGGQVEAATKAAEALKRSVQASNTRDKATNFLEYAGNATKVATIPGASDAGDAILKAKDVVEQGFVIKDSIDLGRQDTFKPGLDRLGSNIREDYDMYMRLNEFRPLFDLPGHRQPVKLAPLDTVILRPNPL